LSSDPHSPSSNANVNPLSISPSIKAESLRTFIEDKWRPLVGQWTLRTAERYVHKGLPVLTLYARADVEQDAKLYRYYASRMRKLAKLTPEVLFTIGNPDAMENQLEADMSSHSATGVAIVHHNMWFEMEGAFSSDALSAFVSSFLAGEVEGTVVTGPTPPSGGEDEEDDGSPSAVVHGIDDTLVEVLAGKDSMVEFYAPWCGHCKSLAPQYKKAANALADAGVETAQLVAVDATEHSKMAEQMGVQGYPTLFFLPGGDVSAAVSYDGPRDSAGIVQFMKENAVTPFKL